MCSITPLPYSHAHQEIFHSNKSIEKPLSAKTQQVHSLAYHILNSIKNFTYKAIVTSTLFGMCCILTPCALVHLGIKMIQSDASWKKVATYTLSLYFCQFLNITHLKKYTWSSEIDEKLTLGALPLKSQLNFFKENQIKNVLCMTEDFELKTPTLTAHPLPKELWKKHEINFTHIPAPDFKPVPLESIHLAVKTIHQAQGKTYVHCKAGVGRSATVVVCYCIKYKNMSAKEAIAFVKTQRPTINLNKKQIAQIYKYEAQLHGRG